MAAVGFSHIRSVVASVLAVSAASSALQIPGPGPLTVHVAHSISQPTGAPSSANLDGDRAPAADASPPQTTTFIPPPWPGARWRTVDAVELFRRAPAPTVQSLANYTYLGCWQDGSNNVLSATSESDFGLTPELCRNLCALKGYPMFGLERGYYCYCDSTLAAFAVSTAESECTSACSGNTNIACGGNNRINIYSATVPLPG